MFGNMSTNDTEIPVAIKPHDNIASALSEFCITQHLISEGHIKPYQTLGFLYLTSSYLDKSGRGIIDDMHSYIDTLPDYISPVLDNEYIEEYFIDPYLSLVTGVLSKKQQNSVHRVTNNL